MQILWCFKSAFPKDFVENRTSLFPLIRSSSFAEKNLQIRPFARSKNIVQILEILIGTPYQQQNSRILYSIILYPINNYFLLRWIYRSWCVLEIWECKTYIFGKSFGNLFSFLPRTPGNCSQGWNLRIICFFLVEEQTGGRREGSPRSSRGSSNISRRCFRDHHNLRYSIRHWISERVSDWV